MATSTRQKQIIRLLQGHYYLEVKELAAELNVDVSTIRRDLQALSKQDLVSRSHGGVMLKTTKPSHINNYDKAEEKAIARAARRLLRPDDTIFIAAGRISDELAKMLLDLRDITVITNSLQVAAILAAQEHITLRLAGGEVRNSMKGGQICAGPATQNFLENYSADWAFIEADGIHPYSGFTTSSPWQVSAQRTMIESSQKVCVVAPSEVFGLKCVGFIQEISKADLILTDENLDDHELPAYRGTVVRSALDTNGLWH